MATVSCKNPSVERSISIDYNFGANLAESIELFGEEAIFNGFVADGKVGLQAFVRARLGKTEEEYMTDEQIIAEAEAWKPGQRKQAADPMAKLQALLAKLTPEQRAAILEGSL